MPWDSVTSFEVKNGEFLRNSDLGNGNFNDLPFSWYLRYLDQIFTNKSSNYVLSNVLISKYTESGTRAEGTLL